MMTDVFEKLKALQDILADKYAIENQIEEVPKKLVSQEELLVRLKNEYIEENALYEEIRVKVAKLKTDLAEADSARERGEKGMDSITSHREYEALEKEIRDATELEQQIRKELQKEENNFNELNEKLRKNESLIANQEAELNAGKESLAKETKELQAKLETLNKQENELEPDIDPEIVFKFERIIKSKHGKGIVAVKGNVCDGCHMILPAQFANEVHTGEKIVFCPYCSRILYYEEDETGENEYFQLDDTGSLADLDDEFDELEEDELLEDHEDIKTVEFEE
ncbi:MAG: C4-type zinc ribbon domain-containing protein [Bacteroides sp.]|nr:C4-type zinc ribbon domain-containing protein [Prevotella sp.]MCM1469640.1 C4-type zinc ribbon domain-containing protein [Bacteroides sp.]